VDTLTPATTGAPSSQPARRRGRVRTTLRTIDKEAIIARLVVLAIVLLVWQLIPTSWVPQYALSRPIDTFRSLGTMVFDGSLGHDTLASLQGLGEGLVIGALLGVAIALLLRVRVIGWLLEPLVILANAVPKVALVTFFVLWLGINDRSHLALVLTFVTFVFIYNMRQAFDEVEPGRLTALRLLGASRFQVARLLVFPSAIPYLLAAIRVAVPLGFAGQVFAELRTPTEFGLGSSLNRSTQGLDSAGAIAILIVVAVIGYLLDIVIGRRLAAYARRIGAGV
jgi:NitT/TauT family transport system permease protein